MKYRNLGNTGLKTSILGFGGAEIGFNQIAPKDVERLISVAIEQGVNLFDTAAAYLNSEILLGQALKDKRNNILISSKCGFYEGFSKSDWSLNGITKTIEQSLKNLQTDYLDIIFLHSCSELEFTWAEALTALIKAKEKGLVRFIGYSGDNAAAYLAIKNGQFDVLETSINVADQSGIDLLLPLAEKYNMGLVAKRPIANVAWKFSSLPENNYIHEYYYRFLKLNYNFQKLPIDQAVAKALSFTLAQPQIGCAIVGTCNPQRFSENLQNLENYPITNEEIVEVKKRWREVAGIDWISQV